MTGKDGRCEPRVSSENVESREAVKRLKNQVDLSFDGKFTHGR